MERNSNSHHPLLQSQLGVFIECMQYPDCTQYNLPTITPLGQEIDLDRLEKTFYAIYHARISWRIRFGIDEEGTPYQFADDTKVFHVVRKEVADDELQVYAHGAFCHPFDLMGDEPLVRVELVTTEKHNYFLIDAHHIVMDGMSFSPLLTVHDINAAYINGVLVKETYNMLNAADDEHKALIGEDYEKAKAYYHNKYANIDFATLSKLPSNPLGKMIREHTYISKTGVVDWCKTTGVAVNLLFQAAFSYVFSVLLREDRIAYTTITHGRFDKRWRNIYGMFSRQVPVMSEIKDGETVMEYIRSFRSELMSTIRYAAYPITHLCHNLSHNLGVSFNFFATDANHEVLEIGDNAYIIHQIERNSNTTDITVAVYSVSGAYDIRVETSEATNSHETALMVADAIKVVIGRMMAQPDAQIKSLPIVSEEEEQQLITLGTGETLEYDKSKTFIDLFKEQVAQTPDAVAVVDAYSQLTYKELDEASTEYANTITSGTFVCVEMPRVKELVVAVLGIWKAGSAYVPIDSEYPDERKRMIREECDGKPLPQSDVAYMIYTSGTTGKPKGVIVQHSALMNFIMFITQEWRMSSKSRISCHSSFAFDASVEDLYPILTVGGALYIIPEEIRTDVDKLSDHIINNGITGGCYSTQIGQILLQYNPKLPVEYIVIGSERMTVNSPCSCRLINTYGPTECTVDATYFELEKGREYTNIPIGRPLTNNTCFILDAANNLLPQGAVGELCIAGPQLALGYYNNPELTKEKFVHLQFDNLQFTIYRTGDLCRWNSEGQLEYIGRIDNQVKLRGFRIELGEIESVALRQAQGKLSQAVAVVKHDQIVLYYTGEATLSSKLMALSSLPEYMIPSVYVHLDEMPLTPNGKIDRKALPEPEYDKGEAIVLPVTKQEDDVLSIVKDILGHPDFSVTANLISLGMSSITAMRLAMRISTDLHGQITMSQLMASPTIRDIASNMQSDEDSHLGKVREKQEYYPLTDNQLGVYLDWEQHRDGLQYNIPYAIKLKSYDADRLRSAIETVVAAHPYLKARLAIVDGEVKLQRRDAAEFHVSCFMFQGGNPQEFFQARVRPFNLFEDNLFRFEIYVVNDDDDDNADDDERQKPEVRNQKNQTLYLFRDIHHIITDGLSDSMLMNEIFAAYRGETIDVETYSSYDRSLEEQEIKGGKEYGKSEKYFRNLLSGRESTVYPHSSDASGDGRSHYVHKLLDKPIIDDHCARLGVTPGNYLLTVFMEVIRRISREDDVLLMTVNNGREHPAMQDIQGFFVKTLPVVYSTQPQNLRTSALGSAAFIAPAEKEPQNLIATIQHQLIETISHECYPLTEMVQKTGIRPEIMYAYEGGLLDNISTETEDMEVIPLSLDTAKVPLTLTVNPQGTEYSLSIEYDDALYSEEDMQTLLRSVITLAQSYASGNASDKQVPLSQYSMLTEEEEQKLVALGTGETLEYDKSKTFIDLFKDQVTKTPDAIAVVDAYSNLTYKELDEASTEYAKTVTSGTFVCLEMPRVKEFVVAVLGIWKAGSAYVPIDTEYPEERKKLMRVECEGKVCPEGTAYMIYTSGSTGTPKGVMIGHRSLINYLHVVCLKENLTSNDRIMCYRSFSFDSHIEDVFPILIKGGTLYIAQEDIRKDILSIREYIKGNGITGCGLPTQFARLILESDDDLPLRFISAGGEKLNDVHSSHILIINEYGPTECTVEASYFYIKPGETYQNIPIGRPIANTQLFVCDDYGHLMPFGAVGELCIAGCQLGMGYYNNPELTAEKFSELIIQNSKFKIYRTGDLCRWCSNSAGSAFSAENTDGQLEYIGRIDNQVKLRGFRIELGEIESVALRQAQGKLCQAVAMVKHDQIVLYYTGEATLSSKLMALSSLPEYMIPSVYVHLDEMPLTPNGKIDRKALPEPDFTSDEEYIAPRNSREQIIADAFKGVLDIDSEVSVTSRFYSIGGDSIKAIRLVSLLHQKGLQISVADIMKLQTVEALAGTAIGMHEEEETIGDPVFYSPLSIFHSTYPLTPMQQGMLLHHLSEPDSHGYRLVSRYRMNAVPTEAQLRAAVDALSAEHEVLRTRIIYKGVEIPQQEITDRKIPVSFEDIRETNRTPEEIHAEQLNLGFDLQEDSLIRMICIITSESECQILIAMHHIITDGWSSPICLSHLFQHLKNAMEGNALNVTEPDGGMFEMHVRSLQMRDKEESLGYWHDLLNGYETRAEITSYENEADNADKVINDHLSASLTKDQTEKLKAVCADKNATLSNATELAWGIVLQRYTRQDDVVFAKVVSCRDKAPEDMSQVVGPFINSVPVRVMTEGKMSVADALMGVSRQSVESNQHDWCSLSEIQQQSSLGSNLFQSILAFENYPISDEIKAQFSETGNKLHIESVANEEEAFNELALSAFEAGKELNLRLTFDKTKYSEAEMHRLLDAWKNVLVSLALHVDSNIEDIALLTEEEEQQLIVLGTGETLEYDKSKTFIDLFKEQAEKTPDAIAVVFKDRQYTYKEIYDKAACIAYHLVEDGVKRETVVGILIDRSEWMVIYPLAVMMAGGTYMPLDITYPSERLLMMCEDADVQYLISENNSVEEKLPEYKGKVYSDLSFMFKTQSFKSQLPKACPSDRFVILYTSGSTGKPKGVQLEYHSIVNFCHWYVKYFGMTRQDRHLAYASFGFDAHMMDIYPALCCGASVYILTTELRLDIEAMNNYMEENSISIAFFTTRLGQFFANTVDNHSLRLLSLGGEKLGFVRKPNYKLYNGYGPTECTIYSSFSEIDLDKDDSVIGIPLYNVSLFIVDKNMNLVPTGMPGEVLIGGEGIGRGYLNRPELTNEKFVELHVSDFKSRVYRTGDLCRWNTDGQLEYIGRIDNQMKLRGFRIELGEIEYVAMKQEGVKQAVAMVRHDQIVLYYTGKRIENLKLEIENSALPEYMHPSAFVHLNEMPLTPNGKIDRKALPEPDFGAGEEYIAPQSRKEKMLCKIIGDELGLEQIGVTDSLKASGMSSIVAMRIGMRLMHAGYSINMGMLLKLDNVRNICDYINQGIDNAIVGNWVRPYNNVKPTMVLCCGVIGSETITRNLTTWFDSYNIYVLQPLFNAWSDVEVITYNEILDRYFRLIADNVHGAVSCIFGFSFGGELAYHLAELWHGYSCQSPLVLMCDTLIDKSELDPDKFEYKDAYEEYYFKLQDEFFTKLGTLPMGNYIGKVILVSAIGDKEPRKVNEEAWRKVKDDIDIIRVNDTHNGLYEHAEHFTQYLEIIESKE